MVLKMSLLCRENFPHGHERVWPWLRDLGLRKDVFLEMELNNHSNNPWCICIKRLELCIFVVVP